MAPHTTNEMRERMVAWHSELGKSNAEIAVVLSVTLLHNLVVAAVL